MSSLARGRIYWHSYLVAFGPRELRVVVDPVNVGVIAQGLLLLALGAAVMWVGWAIWRGESRWVRE
jgi:hypothetical protein